MKREETTRALVGPNFSDRSPLRSPVFVSADGAVVARRVNSMWLSVSVRELRVAARVGLMMTWEWTTDVASFTNDGMRPLLSGERERER